MYRVLGLRILLPIVPLASGCYKSGIQKLGNISLNRWTLNCEITQAYCLGLCIKKIGWQKENLPTDLCKKAC